MIPPRCRGQTMPDLLLGLAIVLGGVSVAVGVSGGVLVSGSGIDGADTQPEAEAILSTVVTSELGAADTPGHKQLDSEAVIDFFDPNNPDREPLEDIVPRSNDTGVIVTLRALDPSESSGGATTFDFILGGGFGNELTRETDEFGSPSTAALPTERTATTYATLDGVVVEVEVRTWIVQEDGSEES